MRKKTGRPDLLRIIVLLLSVAIIIYIWLFVFTPRKIPASMMLMVPGSKLNIMIIGKDYSYDEFHNAVKKNHSDTLILVQVNPFNKKLTLISVPRDSYVEVPGHGFDKINTAYYIGREALVKKTLSRLAGIEVHGYMTIDPKGLVNVIDSLGGINMYVEKNMKYDDSWGGLHIDLKKGKQRLSGKAFEGYVRFRHDSDGDVARVARQQKALKQVFKKMSSPAALISLPWLLPAVRSSVATDLSFPELLRIANFLRTLEPSDIRTFTLPGGTKEGDPHWYVDAEQTNRLLRENKVL